MSLDPLVPQLPAKSRLADLATGLGLPFRAVRVLLGSPKLIAFSLVSAAVTALTLVFVLLGAWRGGQGLAEALIGGGTTLKSAAAFSLGVVLFTAFFVAGALTAPLIVLAPLTDPISEATEARCGDFTAPPFSAGRFLTSTWESVAHTLLRLGFMVAGYVALAPLHLVPVAGSALWAVTSSVWAMFWICAEQLSNPMARHLYRFGQVVRAVWARLPLSLGFGAALYVMLWVPVVNFFLMPVAVVAGTLLFRALAKAGVLAPPSGRA